jgi:hypothetical protein
MNENCNDQIDRTLHALGSATPREGMEERILARLSRAKAVAPAPRFFSLPQFAFGLAAAVLACVVIVAGSVTHSRRILPAPGLSGLHLPAGSEQGVGAASGARVAPQPVQSLPQDRPRSVRKTVNGTVSGTVNGRAVIATGAKKPSGVAVPKTLP